MTQVNCRRVVTYSAAGRRVISGEAPGRAAGTEIPRTKVEERTGGAGGGGGWGGVYLSSVGWVEGGRGCTSVSLLECRDYRE